MQPADYSTRPIAAMHLAGSVGGGNFRAAVAVSQADQNARVLAAATDIFDLSVPHAHSDDGAAGDSVKQVGFSAAIVDEQVVNGMAVALVRWRCKRRR